jgi:hypothetical protein
MANLFPEKSEAVANGLIYTLVNEYLALIEDNNEEEAKKLKRLEFNWN